MSSRPIRSKLSNASAGGSDRAVRDYDMSGIGNPELLGGVRFGVRTGERKPPT